MIHSAVHDYRIMCPRGPSLLFTLLCVMSGISGTAQL